MKQKNPLAPQDGEVQPRLFDDDGEPTKFLNDLPSAVSKHVLAHGGNGFPPILAGEGGKMPTGVVVCVRDRKGLIGYDADGSGRRLDAPNLGALAGEPKPKKTRRSKKGAGSPETAPSPEASSPPPPPAGEQDGAQGKS